jgi:hypothetical protein
MILDLRDIKKILKQRSNFSEFWKSLKMKIKAGKTKKKLGNEHPVSEGIPKQ